MRNRLIPLALLMTVAWLLASTLPALAVTPTVRDGGEFFSPDAIKKANEQIRELYRKYQRDLLIETFKSPPDDIAERIKNASSEERNKLYEEWAKKRIEAEIVNGIYILVTRDPPHLQIEVTPRFTGVVNTSARQRLFNMLRNDFREKNFDAGLEEAIKFMRVKLEDAGQK